MELRGEPPGLTRVVIGVGINVRMPPGAAAAIGQPWTDLTAVHGVPPSRNRLAAQVVAALISMLGGFERDGFAASVDAWSRRDALRDRWVRVVGPQGDQVGVARGIDGDGALRLEVAGSIQRVVSGDVSIRAAA